MLSARQKDLSWKEHLDALRELTASPDSRGDGGGAQPQDAVLAARERRAAKRARQQAAEVVGAHSPAEPAAHDKRESAGARHTAKDTPSEELWGVQATEAVEANSGGSARAGSRLTALDRRYEDDDFVPGGAGGEVTEELFNISSGWSLEVLGDSDDDEAPPQVPATAQVVLSHPAHSSTFPVECQRAAATDTGATR